MVNNWYICTEFKETEFGGGRVCSLVFLPKVQKQPTGGYGYSPGRVVKQYIMITIYNDI